MYKITTSIMVDPELWKKVKMEAVERGITLSEAVEEALKAWLERGG